MRRALFAAMRSDCIIWPGFTQPNGYGRRTVNQKSWLAHRCAYLEAKGPIPDGMLVLHRCDTPGCINPDHLFLGTQADNVADAMSKGRFRVAKGEKSGRSKLLEHDIKMIRLASALGCRQKFLAQKYQILRCTVRQITDRVTWRHVA